jgi:prepilin peptidase CpaA
MSLSIIQVLAPTIALGAAGYDLHSRRIPNFLTFTAAALGLCLNAVDGGIMGFVDSLSGLGLGLGVFLLFYLAGGMGAGDVKLMGGMGAFLGWEKTLYALFLTALVGGIMAAVQLSLNRSWKANFKSVRILLTARMKDPDGQAGDGLEVSGGNTLPYGVAIALGSILAVFLGNNG